MHWHILTPLYEAINTPLVFHLWRRIAHTVAKNAPPDGTVLDIGCGPGTVLRMIRAKRFDLDLSGLDIDPQVLAIAQRAARGLDIRFLLASADKIPLPDKSFDVLVSSLVFHHLTHEEKIGVFREARRLLNQNGSFYLCDFSVPTRPMLARFIRTICCMEPGIGDQMRGELLDIATRENIRMEPLWTLYGSMTLFKCDF